MSRYKRIAIYLLFVGVFSILFGTTYAFFNYTRTGASNELLVGNIYFNHTEGTVITLVDEFPEKKEIARERNDNVIPITITGYNESEKDIYYKLMLFQADDITGKTRIDDKFLRFDLIELLPNNEERYIVFNENFETINNTILVKDRVDAGTSPSASVTRNYQLRMWISDDILISDTDEDADYSTTEFENLFASVKVMAKADTENVYYYSSFDDAITAINDESYASDTTRNLAKVGIYTDSDDNSTNLVFYDDIDINTYYAIRKPVDINLYGHVFSDISTDTEHYTGFDIYAESSIVNGVINSRNEDENHHFYIYVDNTSATVNNIELRNAPWTGETQYRGAFLEIVTGGNFTIKNSDLNVVDLESYSTGKLTISNVDAVGYLYVGTNGKIEVNDSYVYNEKVTIAFISSTGRLEVNNTTIFADSPGCYVSNETGEYYAESMAIMNSGTLIFNSGYAFGTHSAIQTNNGSKTYVYGGTFESIHHGGFYFSHGPTGVAYIENANIGGVNYPAEGKLRPTGSAPSYAGYTREEYKTAFFIGGSSDQNGEKVYLVNCNIYALGSQYFVLRYSAPTQYLYMSGCKLRDATTSQYIRIDYIDRMKLYSGFNNYFGNIETVHSTNNVVTPFETAIQNGIIVETNVDYKGIEKPQ